MLKSHGYTSIDTLLAHEQLIVTSMISYRLQFNCRGFSYERLYVCNHILSRTILFQTSSNISILRFFYFLLCGLISNTLKYFNMDIYQVYNKLSALLQHVNEGNYGFILFGLYNYLLFLVIELYKESSMKQFAVKYYFVYCVTGVGSAPLLIMK